MTVRSLVPLKATKAPTVVTVGNVPRSIKAGISDLLVAFQTGNPGSPEDRSTLLRIYAEAMEGFPLAVVENALRHLKFHNPRNPFRPTPQDVFERCEKILNAWADQVKLFLTTDTPWVQRTERKFVPKVFGYGGNWREAIDYGPEPLTPGAYLPAEIVADIVREHIADMSVEKMADFPRDRFDRIPHEAFPEGAREKAEYIRGLDPEIRRERREILKECGTRYSRPIPEETDLIAEATRNVERRRQRERQLAEERRREEEQREADRRRRVEKFGVEVEAPSEEAA